MEARRLAIAVYLNQRIVFDLLAIVEEGFAQLRAIRTSEAGSDTKKGEIAGEVGVSNVFAFLGVNLKGARTKEGTTSHQREVSEERVFTPASLFSRLRDVLVERKLLLEVMDLPDIARAQPGSFVEFRTVLRKNPLVETLDGLSELMELLTLAGPLANSGKNRTNTPTAGKREAAEFRRVRDALLAGNTIDLIGRVGISGLQVVVPVELEYFSSGGIAELTDGEFMVLGKLVRKIAAQDEPVSLLRGTRIGRLGASHLDPLLQAFAAMQSSDFKFPPLVTEVRDPALQVVPIAIYV